MEPESQHQEGAVNSTEPQSGQPMHSLILIKWTLWRLQWTTLSACPLVKKQIATFNRTESRESFLPLLAFLNSHSWRSNDSFDFFFFVLTPVSGRVTQILNKSLVLKSASKRWERRRLLPRDHLRMIKQLWRDAVYLPPPQRVMSAVNKTGKWDPVWVRISPRKPATINPEVALTASRCHLRRRTVAEEISPFRAYQVSPGLYPLTQGDAWSRWTHRGGPVAAEADQVRNRRLGGEINQSSSATTSPPLREQEAPRWWLYDGWLIQDPSRSTVMDHSEPETGHWPRLRSCWLGGRGGFKGKGTSSCGDGNMLMRSEGSCRVHWSVCLLPIRCLTCGIPRRMDMSCKARPTRAMFLFSWNACVVRYA